MNHSFSKLILTACTLTVAAATIVSTPVMAEHQPGHEGHKDGDMAKLHEKMHDKKEDMMKEFYEEVKATPEQRTKLDSLHQQFEVKAEPLRKDIWTKKSDLMSYIASPQSTQPEAMKKEQEIDQLKSQMDQMYIEHAFQKKAVLNPDQQQKAADFFKKKSQEWHNHADKEDHGG